MNNDNENKNDIKDYVNADPYEIMPKK